MNDTQNKEHGLKSSPMILTPLGTGGWIPVKNRHTACYALQKDTELIILDFGTGVSRLLKEFDFLLNGVEKITGFISHYHPDHTIGLFYLPAITGERKLELYTPGKGIYEKSSRELMNEFFDPPFLPRKLSKMLPGLEINDIPLEGMKIGDMEFSFRVQKSHVHPSVAVRIGDKCVYCTDTEPEYETIGFAMGAKLLLHECWYEDEIPAENIPSADVKELLTKNGKGGHSSNLAVALIGRESRVNSVYTIHHNPNSDLNDISRMAKDVAFICGTEISACEDGATIEC